MEASARTVSVEMDKAIERTTKYNKKEENLSRFPLFVTIGIDYIIVEKYPFFYSFDFETHACTYKNDVYG